MSKRKIIKTIVFIYAMLAFQPAQANVTIFENFKTSSAPGWVFGGTAKLTSGSPDPVGQGWLRLTERTGTNQFGYVYYNVAYAAPFGFAVDFDFGAWGGTGADGFTMFLFDGSTVTFNIGDAGGSMGYANGCGGIPGLSNGYMGIAIDAFGNFSAPEAGTRCKIDGPGRYANSVTLRGRATNNYNYITHKQLSTTTLRLDCPSSSCGTARPLPTVYYRQARVQLVPNGINYDVTMFIKTDPLNDFEVALPKTTMPLPVFPTLKIGFAATTGGSNNAHEIRNMNIDIFEAYTDLSITGGFVYSLFGGKTTEFRADVFNNGPNLDNGPVNVKVDLPSGVTYSGMVGTSLWSCTPSGQIVNCTYPGPFLANALLPPLRMEVGISSAVGGQTLLAKAKVSGDAFDINETNNLFITSRYVFGVVASGTKNLYTYFLNRVGTGTFTANTLQRKRPGSGGMLQSNTGLIDGAGGRTAWLTLTPSLAKNVVIPASDNFEINLCINRPTGNPTARNIRVEIKQQNTPDSGAIGVTFTPNPTLSTTVATTGFTAQSVDIAHTTWTVTPSNPLQMRIINNSPAAASRITVHSSCGNSNGIYSSVDFFTTTVVNVDKVEVHNAVFPNNNLIVRSQDNGTTVYARSVISDPFGSFDITNAVFEMYDKNNNLVAGPTNMTQVNDNVAAGEKTYQLGFTVPSWTASSYVLQVTGKEGIENKISHTNVTDFIVDPAPPVLTMTKVASSPSADPGSVVSYTVQVSNSGIGNATSVEISDVLPKFVSLGINTYGTSKPVSFVDGSPVSGLTMGPLIYSNDDGATWTYTPVSGGGGAPVGYDGDITHFKIPFTGNLAPSRGFTLLYNVRLE